MLCIRIKRNIYLREIDFQQIDRMRYPESSIVVEGKLYDKVYLDFIVNDLDT